MTWVALALALAGLALGVIFGAAVMTWWSSKRIEREASRRYELGVAEGLRLAQGQRDVIADAAEAGARRHRREALLVGGGRLTASSSSGDQTRPAAQQPPLGGPLETEG